MLSFVLHVAPQLSILQDSLLLNQVVNLLK